MGAVWLVVRAELRHRWRSWLALVLLVAVVGGLVLGATAAGRRTATAFPRFTKTYGYDVFVYSFSPLPTLASLPEVRSVLSMTSPANGAPTCRCKFKLTTSDFGVSDISQRGLHHLVKLVSGRWPDPNRVDEVLASFTFAHDEGIHIGSVIRMPIYAPNQVADAQSFSGTPAGPTQSLRVVGIEASEVDFPSVGTPSYSLWTTPAFARKVEPRSFVFYGYAVTLRHGEADAPAFDAAVAGLGAGGTSDMSLLESTVDSTIHPQAVGWWVLALLAGVAGLAVIAQALSRQSKVETDTTDALSALGMEPPQLRVVGVTRALGVGVAGAVGAVLIAFALSPLAPVGEARVAEPSTGAQFDVTVLGLGALAVIVCVVLSGLWPAWRDSRRAGAARSAEVARPSAVVARLAAAGAPVPTVIGVRRALERGSGRSSVPVGSALAGTALAVAALCATSVFGASLLHLTSTPRLYGQSFGVWFRSFTDPATPQQVISSLRRDHAVRAITLGLEGPGSVDGTTTTILAARSLEGPLQMSASTGRLPRSVDEIALGAQTLGQAGARVGSVVRISFPLPGGGSRSVRMRVVGTSTFPPDFGIVGFGTGAIVTVGGYVAAQCPPGPSFAACQSGVLQKPAILVGMRPGAAGRAAAIRYADTYPAYAALPVKPTNLVNFGQAVNFPLILGVVLGLFGAATLFHVLVVSVARRRRELGLLEAIGFVRSQVAAAVGWQATTVALVGVVVGVPVGLAVGRFIWDAFATNLGVVPESVLPVVAVMILSLAVLAAANLLAVGPAVVSARSRPGVLLRTE